MAGVTTIDTSAVVTVRLTGADDIFPAVAVIVVGPAFTAVASPVLLIFAMPGADELHVTADERD